MTEGGHYHWHQQVAETATYFYFQCACGSRKAGRKATAHRDTPADAEWLAGADRRPA